MFQLPWSHRCVPQRFCPWICWSDGLFIFFEYDYMILNFGKPNFVSLKSSDSCDSENYAVLDALSLRTEDWTTTTILISLLPQFSSGEFALTVARVTMFLPLRNFRKSIDLNWNQQNYSSRIWKRFKNLGNLINISSNICRRSWIKIRKVNVIFIKI